MNTAKLPDVEQIAPLIRGKVSLDALKAAGILPIREDEERFVVALSSLDAFPNAQVLAASFGKEADWELHSRESMDLMLGRLYDLRGGVGGSSAATMTSQHRRRGTGWRGSAAARASLTAAGLASPSAA